MEILNIQNLQRKKCFILFLMCQAYNLCRMKLGHFCWKLVSFGWKRPLNNLEFFSLNIYKNYSEHLILDLIDNHNNKTSKSTCYLILSNRSVNLKEGCIHAEISRTVIDEPFLFTDSYKCTMHWATHIREFIRAENL